jgi:hypothetical protein
MELVLQCAGTHDSTHPFLFLAAAGGAGLLGGLVLAEGFEHHERREEEERQEAFDQGQLCLLVVSYSLI